MELVLFAIMFVGMGSIYFWVCVFLGCWLLVLGLFLVLGLSVCGLVSM